ncbi:MAG: dihydroneopterin aldolase [Xanthobacteraceae bacterium]|nr:dihydroneopterin aldolase [Xanthobacteraceae bacterium]MBV9234496.1 dihydroneopterin aldolase [Xanthobacteraceae bacterium]
MSDTIFVSGLLIHAHHGVMAHEEKVGQRFVIDLELTTDLATASRSDKLADTVNYGAIVDTTTEVFTGRRYRLIEAAAGAVADAILTKFVKVSAVRITVRKPHAPIAAIFGDAGVTLTRKRDA